MLLFPNGLGACDILNVLNYVYVSYSNISNPGWHHVWWTSMSRAQYPEQLPARWSYYTLAQKIKHLFKLTFERSSNPAKIVNSERLDTLCLIFRLHFRSCTLYITFHWCSRTLSFLWPYVSLFKLLILATNFDWNKCEMSINKYELFFHCAVQRSWCLFGTLLGVWKSEVPNFGPKKVPILLESPKCRLCRQMQRQITNSALIALTVSLRDGWRGRTITDKISFSIQKLYCRFIKGFKKVFFWNEICRRSF